ncbi:hypothetical protein AVEN_70277-1 [Araneus ventricosus]|uniref:Tc1-like transposase DDE domain-containing protein n=1 Tax=Araneus ventricosus TaxID=182803 RepID=A0A4Y2TLP0_ARAVE|nr:hypothetical protein AVEN_70277-1 [Araneus ventricosus]
MTPHTSRVATVWLQEHPSDFRHFHWPPKSTDMNIIEYIWDAWQRALQKRSQLSRTPMDLWTALQDSWTWALRDLSSQVRFLNSGNKGDPDHYATDCPVTKPFYFMKPSAENLSTWCENIVQNKRSLAQLMNIMKILHQRRHDILID